MIHMKSGENLNANTDNYNTNPDIAGDWESLVSDESELTAPFAAHALRKLKARKRIEQNQSHSKPETPYKQRRKKIERILGHAASMSSIREKTTDRQAIKQELKDYGASSVDELGNLEYLDNQVLSPEQVFEKFDKLFTFLGEDTKGDPNIVEEYMQATDRKEQLKLILSSSLSDRVRLFCSECFDYPNYDHFMQKLQFQQDLLNGDVKVWTQEWSERKGRYINVQKPLLDPSGIDKKDTQLGLNRATLQSAMIGTPEYGAYIMALDIMRDRNWVATSDFPIVNGYKSSLYTTSIGPWEEIIDEYDTIAKKVAERNPDMSDEDVEHIAVRRAARLFADSAAYNVTDRGPDSPYISSFHESVAWAQLGSEVQKQLRGMRQKIMGSDLHNIERFIGKSGYSQKRGSMQAERSRLSNRLNYINGLPDDAKQEFLNKENAFEIKKQEEWREKEIARIGHKYEMLIGKTRSEERRAIYASRQEEEIQKVISDTSERIEYFEHRPLDGLLSDIDKRRELLTRRIEKRKSLAEKAIDLHFRLDVKHRVWDSELEDYIEVDNRSRYHECLDWINDVPFGTIKRAHTRMIDGMPADEIYKLAISEVIRKSVNDPDQANAAIQQLFQDAKNGSSDTQRIRAIMRMAGKLYKYSKELSYSDLESMSSRYTEKMGNIEDSLAAFPLSDVKRFVENGLNLSLVPRLSRVAERFGYELDTDQLIELSSKKAINRYYYKDAEGVFASTLRYFSLDEAMIAMDANVNLMTLSKLKSMLSPETKYGVEQLITGTKVIETTGMHIEDACELLRNGKMNLDTIKEYPWLVHQYSHESCGGADIFPANKPDSAKYKWCSDNSFVWLDGNWGRQTIGKIIYTRLQSGVEKSVHDATQWLNAFQIPEIAYDIPGIKRQAEQGAEEIDVEKFAMRLFDKEEEKRYLAKILSAPQSIRERLNLSIKPQNISKLFSSPEHIFIYIELAKVLKNPEIDLEKFQATIKDKMNDYYDNNIASSTSKNPDWRMSFEDFEKRVNEALNSILQITQSDDDHTSRIGEIAQRLNRYGLNRKAYIDDATSWLVKHAVSPSSTLTKAWSDRPYAIACGIKDNASEINIWSKTTSLAKTKGEYLARNGISEHDLATIYAPLVHELIRCYGTDTAASAIVEYKNCHNPDKTMPASSIALEVKERKFTGEVLAHDDPRGMTIGFDTGCCMTVDGASRDCIKSGYRDPGAGFFAFYDEHNRINAQSYFYINQEYPEIVVMDNIEANAGRDSDFIIDVYRKFFREYLKNRFANDPNWKIRQVNVGTGYGDVAKAQVLRLKPTKIIPNNLSSYSDAREDQRLLVYLSDAEIAEARGDNQNTTHGERVKPNHLSTLFVSPLGINQLPILQSLESQLYPEVMRQYDDDDYTYQELTMPGVDKYSFLIKNQRDATSETDGYCLAYEDGSRTDPNYPSKVVYIADFGILPRARGLKATREAFDELLRRIDENGIKKIELEARESTSYALLNNALVRRYLAKKGYTLIEYDDTELFGDSEITHLISLEKISE